MDKSIENRLKCVDVVIESGLLPKGVSELFSKKDVVYSREYATTPDMNCPVCDKVLLTNYPRFCSDCGTRLHYRGSEEDE